MYGQLDKFASWIEAMHARTFFLSAYGVSTHEENEALKSQLDDANLRYKTAPPKKLLPGSITFIDAGPDVKHDDFVTEAGTQHPLASVLSPRPRYLRLHRKRSN